jgi:hypothetical protein
MRVVYTVARPTSQRTTRQFGRRAQQPSRMATTSAASETPTVTRAPWRMDAWYPDKTGGPYSP